MILNSSIRPSQNNFHGPVTENIHQGDGRCRNLGLSSTWTGGPSADGRHCPKRPGIDLKLSFKWPLGVQYKYTEFEATIVFTKNLMSNYGHETV